jgi:hypothetical protein
VSATDPFEKVVHLVAGSVGVEPIRCTRPGEALDVLRKSPPRHVLVVVRPDVLDVNFAYELLDVATKVDDDPFADFTYGIVTGRDPEAALAFWNETQAVRTDPRLVPQRLLDIAGPNALDDDRVMFWGRAVEMPWARKKLEHDSLNHGKRGYPDAQLGRLSGFGFVHLHGHGWPDRIDCGLTAEQLQKVDWRHAIVWNGACYTGVTSRWFDATGGAVVEKTAPSSFCLSLLERGTSAYFAALHPDHGAPVMQEVEYAFSTGAPLGLVLKHTHDALVLARGGKPIALPRWKAGPPPAPPVRGQVEFDGTAARVLFGDPRAQPVPRVCSEALAVETAPLDGGGLRIAVRPQNVDLAWTPVDVFHWDLVGGKAPFNHCLRVRVAVPPGFAPTEVRVRAAQNDGVELEHRLVGFALEDWHGERFLHVQVDFAAKDLIRSAFWSVKTKVELEALPAR